MSKAIYNLKLLLLSKVFKMSEKELNCVMDISVFIVIFYVKIWFQSSFGICAARNDLQFMAHMLKYRLYKPTTAFVVLQNCRRHLWYLCSQLIPLALCDKELENSEREGLAKAIHAQPRNKIET